MQGNGASESARLLVVATLRSRVANDVDKTCLRWDPPWHVSVDISLQNHVD